MGINQEPLHAEYNRSSLWGCLSVELEFEMIEHHQNSAGDFSPQPTILSTLPAAQSATIRSEKFHSNRFTCQVC